MPIESFPNITIDLSYHEPEIGSAPTTYPHVSSIRGINNCIGNIRRWLEQKELKANRKEVSLPEELFTSLISEFNLRASQNDTASLKEIDPQDIEFILQCISGQVRVGMQAVEKTASCQSEEMGEGLFSTLFCSLEACLLSFTIFGCMDLTGQEDVRHALGLFSQTRSNTFEI